MLNRTAQVAIATLVMGVVSAAGFATIGHAAPAPTPKTVVLYPAPTTTTTAPAPTTAPSVYRPLTVAKLVGPRPIRRLTTTTTTAPARRSGGEQPCPDGHWAPSC